MKLNKRHDSAIFFQVIWVASIGVVAYLSLYSDVDFLLDIKNIDKVYHALAYLWLAVIPFVGFQRFKLSLVGALLMIPFGISIEYAQGFVDGRIFSLSDMVANVMGVTLGVILGGYLKYRFFSV